MMLALAGTTVRWFILWAWENYCHSECWACVWSLPVICHRTGSTEQLSTPRIRVGGWLKSGGLGEGQQDVTSQIYTFIQSRQQSGSK